MKLNLIAVQNEDSTDDTTTFETDYHTEAGIYLNNSSYFIYFLKNKIFLNYF